MRIDEIRPTEVARFLKKAKKGKWTGTPKRFTISEGMPPELFDWLDENGFEFLGEGVSSSAWLHKTGRYVVKISVSSDPAWLAYARFTQVHKNPHFLKVYGLKTFKIKGQIYFLALLERLYPARLSNKFLADLNYYAEAFGYDWLTEIEPDDYKEVQKRKAKFETQYPDLANALKALQRKFWPGEPPYIWDLHYQNIMKRQNGQLVLSDPIA